MPGWKVGTMKRKTGIVVGTVVGSVAVAGVAWAALTATITVPAISTGFGTAPGSSSCQTAPVTFEVPSPTWSPQLGDYAVSSIAFGSITSTCVNIGTADLILTVTMPNSNAQIATGTASNLSSSSGTITLSNAIPFELASEADYYFLVRNA